MRKGQRNVVNGEGGSGEKGSVRVRSRKERSGEREKNWSGIYMSVTVKLQNKRK